jgi:SAM-dependent methyltransferase
VRDARLTSRLDAVGKSADDAQGMAAMAQQTSLSLKREVERALANVTGGPGGAPPVPSSAALPAASADLDGFKYVGFENQFRGSVETIRGRLEAYLPIFDGASDVLDVGCGRGEFLDLLRGRGIAARGVDVNEAMVEEARARGLEASRGDALGYLRVLPDGSIGGLFAAQVVEHLAPDYLGALLEVAATKIRPGGAIVLETINPSCWVAFFESYIRDLTHVRPLHPETLKFLLQVNGFTDVHLTYSSPVAASDRLQPVVVPGDAGADVREVAEALNDAVTRLNARLFSYQDYAAIGRR